MAVSHYYFFTGGTRTVMKEFSQKLIKKRHQVDILTVNVSERGEPLWKKEISDNGQSKIIRWPACKPFVRIKYLNRLFPRIFNSIFFLKWGLRKVLKDYDIIQFFDVNDLTFPLFFFFTKKPKIFVCATLAERFNLYQNSPIPRFILTKSCSLYFASNQNTARILKELGVDESKIKNIPYSVDVEKYTTALEKKKDNIILFIGAFEERKGIHILLDSLWYLKNKVELVMAGPIRDSKYFNNIQKHFEGINKKGFHKITYLSVVDEKELIDLYQKAAIFICPSISEEFGIVIIEAFACGTPVIASKIGGISYVVKHFENGILVNHEDPVELSEEIDMLLNNIDMRNTMGKMAREYVVENFSSEKVASRIENVFLNVKN
ncbi:MAG: hypothetical protein A2043_10850 [Candidatus Schekmanbacteria bacterium GWA2_38_9]|nr:MAG: hypothetical protein A2043_10850 [Candidatus Schekmanbacteria bacterium GWA2_38_9]